MWQVGDGCKIDVLIEGPVVAKGTCHRQETMQWRERVEYVVHIMVKTFLYSIIYPYNL